MELTENRILSFNVEHAEIFDKVDIEGHPLYLNGSFASSSPFAGDIDLYTRVSHDDLPEVVKLVRGFLRSKMVITKVRIGERRFYGTKSIRDGLKSAKELLGESPETKSWVKVNMLLFTGENLEELSIVYDFSTKRLSDAEIQESIRADIVEYEHDEDWYKVLKRKRLLLRPDSIQRKYIDRILDRPDVGQLYLARVGTETLMSGKGLFPMKELQTSLGNLRELVRIRLKLKEPGRGLQNLTAFWKHAPKIIAFLRNEMTRTLSGHF